MNMNNIENSGAQNNPAAQELSPADKKIQETTAEITKTQAFIAELQKMQTIKHSPQRFDMIAEEQGKLDALISLKTQLVAKKTEALDDKYSVMKKAGLESQGPGVLHVDEWGQEGRNANRLDRRQENYEKRNGLQ